MLFKVESKGPTTGNQIKPTSANPPSDVILATFKKYKKVPSSKIIQETAEKVLLSVEETKMWFEHLHQISVNRAEGARKAAETRKRKKANAHAKPANSPNHTPSDDQFCLACEMINPPCDSSSDVEWIGCERWCHMSCTDIVVIPETWLCINCCEVW